MSLPADKIPGSSGPGREPQESESQVVAPAPPAHLDAALAYAAAGWPVFPLNGKTTLKGSHGFYDATTDLDQIRTWWTARPRCNIGTGIPLSLVAVDVDAKKDGLTTLYDLEQSHGVPETLSVLTGGGGLHLYFLNPGGDLRQGADILGPGIDTRIPGKGYTVLPPSLHESGRLYEWYDESVAPAAMPRWMIDRLRPAKPQVGALRGLRASGGDTQGRLAGVLSVVTPDGPNWNDRLHWAACRAGEMVRDDGADPQRLAQLLLDAAGPWNEREARAAVATIKSGMNRTGVAA